MADRTIARGAAHTAATAAGAGDNSAVTGATIDLSAQYFPRELLVCFSYTTTLAAGKKLFLKSMVVQHDTDSAMGTAATYATLEDDTGTAIATHATGGTVTGTKVYEVDLGGAKRYIRVNYTPDLDASGTDTAQVECLLSMGKMYRSTKG
jgi:hypothetical protein